MFSFSSEGLVGGAARLAMVSVVSPVERRCRVRKHPIESYVVAVDVVNSVGRNKCGVLKISEIAEDQAHRDIEHVVSEATAVRPSTGHHSIPEPLEDGALQHITARRKTLRPEDSEPRKIDLVGIRKVTRPRPGKSGGTGREVDLDQIGDEDPHEVDPLGGIHLKETSKLGRRRIAPEQLSISERTCAVIAILIGKGNKRLAEERVPLSSNLNEVTRLLIPPIGTKNGHGSPARRRVNAGKLLVSTDVIHRNVENKTPVDPLDPQIVSDA